ncbi:MAG: N-acetyltransferase [Syntrophus sp. (in: bacteria)]|nr:N-acetyltransferase [Syntrophus sp. (in: bacteria)]
MYTMETERLVLRELRDSDMEAIIGMLGSKTVMLRLFGGSPMTAHEARLFIDEHFTFGREVCGIGVLCEKEGGSFVGFAGLLPCRYLNENDFEVGVALQEASQGKGYATEIGLAQITYGFKNFDVDRLLALAHPENTGSLRAFEKLGMKFLQIIETDKRGPRCIYVSTKMMVKLR